MLCCLQNVIASAYGKESISALLGPNNENIIDTRDDKNIADLLAHGLQLPEPQENGDLYAPNVPQDTQGVKDSIFRNRENDTENQ